MDLKQFIKNEALRLGFTKTGIAPAEYDPIRHSKFIKWLKNDFHAGMSYLEKEKRKRFDPSIHLADAESVIVCAQNYYSKPSNNPKSGYVSIYARGEDYHIVIRDKLERLCDKIKGQYGRFRHMTFVDSSPISEKTLAVKAGIGFMGRNGVVIIPKLRLDKTVIKGSFFFLGIIISNLKLEPDSPADGTCGKCRRCIDSCPTGAILDDYTIDARRCISYHNTQNRGDIPEEIAAKMDNMVFGCDICQIVCPYNNKPIETSEPRFYPRDFLINFDIVEFLKISENKFKEQFADTVICESGFKRIRRNTLIVSKKSHN